MLIWCVQMAAHAVPERPVCRSDEDTTMDGEVTVRGGLLYGTGGFCEVSGRAELQFDGPVSVTSVGSVLGLKLDDGPVSQFVEGGFR